MQYPGLMELTITSSEGLPPCGALASITQVREEIRAITLIMNMKGKPLDLALTVDESLLKTKEENKEANLHVGVELLIAKLDEVYYSIIRKRNLLQS